MHSLADITQGEEGAEIKDGEGNPTTAVHDNAER